jgi:hypothetical protein
LNANSFVFYLIPFLLLACSSAPTPEEAQSLRSYYCSGSTTIRNPTYNIILKIKPPKGIPVESVATGTQHLRESLKSYMKYGFLYNVMSDYAFVWRGVSSDYLEKNYYTRGWGINEVGGGGWPEFQTIAGSWSIWSNRYELPEDKRLAALYQNFDFPISFQAPAYLAKAMSESDNEIGQQFSEAHYIQGPQFNKLWFETTVASTEVAEATDEDGSIHYTVTLNMDLFCKHAVQKPDLYSKWKEDDMNSEELIRQGNVLIAAAGERKASVSEDDLRSLQRDYVRWSRNPAAFKTQKWLGIVGALSGLVILACGQLLGGIVILMAGAWQFVLVAQIELHGKQYVEIVTRESAKLSSNSAAWPSYKSAGWFGYQGRENPMDENDAQEMFAELEALRENIEVLQELFVTYIKASKKEAVVNEELKDLEAKCESSVKRSTFSRIRSLLSSWELFHFCLFPVSLPNVSFDIFS